MLGREDEAMSIFESNLEPKAEENRSALSRIQICSDRTYDAAAILTSRLQNDSERDAAISAFARSDSAGVDRSSFLKSLLQRAAAVESRPAVQEEFLKHARPIAFKGHSSYWGSF